MQRSARLTRDTPPRTPARLSRGPGGADLATGAHHPAEPPFRHARQRRARAGGYAEYVTLPEAYAAPAPTGLDPVHAASLPLAGLTAGQALAAPRLSSRDTLLVNGSRGAIGGFAVQLAIRYGTQVVSTGPADAALDVVGGPAARETFAAVQDGGRYVTVVPEFWVPGGSSPPRAGSSRSC
jgi:NADPH:quinone reductase